MILFSTFSPIYRVGQLADFCLLFSFVFMLFQFSFTWYGVVCKIGKIQMSSNKVNFRIYFYKSIVDILDRILSILLALYLQSRCEVQTLPFKATFFNSFLHTVSPQSTTSLGLERGNGKTAILGCFGSGSQINLNLEKQDAVSQTGT